MTVTLADLAAEITQKSREVIYDTDHLTLEANGFIAKPWTDETLRNFLQKLVSINQMTITVDVKSKLKVFSKFRMEDVCALYGLEYDSVNPHRQFPVFECQDEHVDDNLLSYLMQELNSRIALTPENEAPEAHHSIYIYCILHAIAKSSTLELMVLAERYVVGSKAMGKVDYSIELGNGPILGITEVKRNNFSLGIAQNAMQIRSAVEYNKRRKLGIDQRCFGIATNAERWYFLQYIPGQTPMISKEYQAMFQGKFLRDEVSKIVGILSWLLKVVSDTEPQKKKLKLEIA